MIKKVIINLNNRNKINRLKKRILLIVGGEICHSYFCNKVRLLCKDYLFDIIRYKSNIPDFNFYFDIYSANSKSDNEIEKIIKFVLRRNRSFALNANYSLLRVPDNSELCSNESEFRECLETKLNNNDE